MKRIKTPEREGDPLVTVMQLTEIITKLDDIIERLERLEQQQTARGIKPESSSAVGSAPASVFPPPSATPDQPR